MEGSISRRNTKPPGKARARAEAALARAARMITAVLTKSSFHIVLTNFVPTVPVLFP
jgi:hypothetical protein